MSKNVNKFILLVAVLALGLAVAALIVSLKPAEQPAAQPEVKAEEQTEAQPEVQPNAKDVQYVLYLGTNDKNTGVMGFESREAAKAKAAEILIANFGGYTIQEAEGGWIDGNGNKCQEYTLVIYLSDTTLEKVHAVSDELLTVFNQSSILIQANETTTEFYEGAEIL